MLPANVMKSCVCLLYKLCAHSYHQVKTEAQERVLWQNV